MPAENITIKANWTINQYTITFDTDGGSVIAPITQDYGTDVKAPTDPTKEGYTFAGWDVQIPEQMPAGNMTIKANWTVNTYDYVIKDGNVILNSGSLDYGEEIPVPTTPEKEGHTFKGWFAGNDEITFPVTMPAGDLEISAKWDVNSYDYVIKNGDEIIASGRLDYGETIPTPATPEKEGHTFLGWFEGEEAVRFPVQMPVDGLTLEAKWSINSYKVVWNIDGVETEEYYSFGETISMPANPTKEGYTFVGWLGEIPETMPAGNLAVSLTSDWQINSYKLTWIVDGKQWEETYDYGAIIDLPANPTKEGYTFVGWLGEIPEIMPAKDLTVNLTSDWKINSHKVTWIVDGAVTEETYVYGETIKLPADPTKEHYEFTGWDALIPETMPDSDLTFVATWRWCYTGFLADESGDLYHYVDGELSKAGLILVNGEFYYVRTTTGEVVTDRVYWVTETNGLMKEGNYTFDEQGRMIDPPAEALKNGFYHENGGIYHYVKGKLSKAGLILVDGEFYYVRTTTGQVVTGRVYWVTVTNDLMAEGNYTFDEQGRMIDPPAEALKNGFYEENGGIYHYVDGQLSKAGLIYVDGYYYYVRTSSGEVVTARTYWITVTNGLAEEGNYTFDALGRITNPPSGAPVIPDEPDEPEEVKNGFVSENGGIYYYVDGQLQKCGLVLVDGYYYYVRTSSGEVVTGRSYWVTYTNDLMDEGNYTFDAQGRMILD